MRSRARPVLSSGRERASSKHNSYGKCACAELAALARALGIANRWGVGLFLRLADGAYRRRFRTSIATILAIAYMPDLAAGARARATRS